MNTDHKTNSVKYEIESNVEPNERTTPLKSVRKRSRRFRIKLRMFCVLHRPVSLRSRSYHYMFFVLIFLSCIVFNVFDGYFGENALILMSLFDSCVCVLLTVELILRLWSADCIQSYRGFDGRLRYLKTYGFMRGLDLIGVITFSAFIFRQEFDDNIGLILRLFHILQVFQLYRLLLPLIKLMASTILDQFLQLYIALIFVSIALVVISQGVYLVELEGKHSIFDSFWFGYITLATIGYGDVTPVTDLGRLFTCVLACIGICMYQLPANIFGTGLAIKLKEQQKNVLFLNPASNLIQSFWKCYATDNETKMTSVWNLLAKNRSNLSDLDKQCICFIYKLKYFSARRQFRAELRPNTFGNESLEQLELWSTITRLEARLSDLKDKTFYTKIYLEGITKKLELILKHLEKI